MAHQFRLGNKIRMGRYFGFREGRSTTDAIAYVRALSDQSVSRGGVAIAVSFDIANAFKPCPGGLEGGADLPSRASTSGGWSGPFWKAEPSPMWGDPMWKTGGGYIAVPQGLVL